MFLILKVRRTLFSLANDSLCSRYISFRCVISYSTFQLIFKFIYIFKIIFSQNNCYKLFYYTSNTKDHKFKSYVKSKVKTNLNIPIIQINTSVFKNRLAQLWNHLCAFTNRNQSVRVYSSPFFGIDLSHTYINTNDWLYIF